MSHPNAVVTAGLVLVGGFALTHYVAALTPLGAVFVRVASLVAALGILSNSFFR